MNAPGKGLLKVSGILLIIFGAIAIVLMLLALVASVALIALSPAALILVLACIIGLAGAVLDLIAGILGVKNCDKPEKAKSCFVFGIILIAIQVVSMVLSISGGSFDWTSIVGLVLPVLYLVGASQNKKFFEQYGTAPTVEQ